MIKNDNSPILGACYNYKGSKVRIIGVHNWPSSKVVVDLDPLNTDVDVEHEPIDGPLGVIRTVDWVPELFGQPSFEVREIVEPYGWPGDGSGEDDFADYNLNEGNDW